MNPLPTTPATPAATPSPSSTTPFSPFADTPSSRTGKIARLPAAIRHQLNLRLLNNEPGQNILSWVNSLPETRQILRDHFQNNPVSPQNLSEWRSGGHREWLLREELLHHAAALRDSASSLQTIDDPAALADNLAAVLAARYAALLNSWDGEITPAFEAKVKILRGLTRDITTLQKSIHQAAALRAEQERQAKEQADADFEKSKARALSLLKAPLRQQRHMTYAPALAPAIIAIEDAASPSALAQLLVQFDLIKPNQTSSGPAAVNCRNESRQGSNRQMA